MQPLTSPLTFVYKRLFPLFWFGFLAVFLGMHLFAAREVPPLPFLLAPIVMMGFGYFILRKLVFDLVDEVVDLGDVLRIRRGSEEIRVPLGDIVNVDRSRMINPARVTLRLRSEGKFGREIAFMPRGGSPLFGDNAMISALIDRIDAQRRQQR